MLRIGVLASGEGTTLQSLLDSSASGDLNAEVAVVISNNSGSGALRRAGEHQVPIAHLSGRTHPDPDALDEAIMRVLETHDVELVVLAGYMKKIGPQTLSRFAGRILNTHPALLPKFGGQGMFGEFVHRAVLEAGEDRSGASVFVVTEEYDEGPVIGRGEVPVLPGDTIESLAARVQAAEKQLLTQVINDVVAGRVGLVASSDA